MKSPGIPLPGHWPKQVKSVILHVISLAQTARIFMVDPDTISGWMKRINDNALIQTPLPINKFPDLTHYIIQRLKILCPLMGKKRIAHCLTIAGSVFTVSVCLLSVS